jgi:hypothetical protein
VPARPADSIRSGPELTAEPTIRLPSSGSAKSITQAKAPRPGQLLEGHAAHAGGVEDRHLEARASSAGFSRFM